MTIYYVYAYLRENQTPTILAKEKAIVLTISPITSSMAYTCQKIVNV